jgi:hypothetical protein
MIVMRISRREFGNDNDNDNGIVWENGKKGKVAG